MFVASGGPAWLWLALGSETGRDDPVSAAHAAVELLADGLDGARWLTTAPFDTIMYGILLRDGPPGPANFRIRRRELEIDTILDARTVPADPSWWFLRQVQHVLEAVAERFDLGLPPLRELYDDPGSSLPPLDSLPPVDQNADADISAEVEALEDDEMLVVVPYQLPGEDEQALFSRRLHTDTLLTDILGAPPSASGTTGNAYVFTFPMPNPRRNGGGRAPP